MSCVNRNDIAMETAGLISSYQYKLILYYMVY